MSLFTYHIAQTSVATAISALVLPLKPGRVPGLLHAECMSVMTLGAPILSPARMQLTQLAVFALWEEERFVDEFLLCHRTGIAISKGWHIRLAYLRQWGSISQIDVSQETPEPHDETQPVVAVTLARMKLPEVPRFIHWGRPAEMLVRDHPGSLFSLASIRLPNTVSTFSIWKSQAEMLGMVHGRSAVHAPTRHRDAMKERNRKDFHFEFTTLRFKPISEHGEWNGRKHIVANNWK